MDTVKEISETEFWQNIMEQSPFWKEVFDDLLENEKPKEDRGNE